MSKKLTILERINNLHKQYPELYNFKYGHEVIVSQSIIPNFKYIKLPYWCTFCNEPLYYDDPNIRYFKTAEGYIYYSHKDISICEFKQCLETD